MILSEFLVKELFLERDSKKEEPHFCQPEYPLVEVQVELKGNSIRERLHCRPLWRKLRHVLAILKCHVRVGPLLLAIGATKDPVIVCTFTSLAPETSWVDPEAGWAL